MGRSRGGGAEGAQGGDTACGGYLRGVFLGLFCTWWTLAVVWCRWCVGGWFAVVNRGFLAMAHSVLRQNGWLTRWSTWGEAGVPKN